MFQIDPIQCPVVLTLTVWMFSIDLGVFIFQSEAITIGYLYLCTCIQSLTQVLWNLYTRNIFCIIMFIHLFLIQKCVVIIVWCLLIFFLKSFMLLFSDSLRAILPICFSILIARFYCWFDMDFLLHNEIKKVLLAFKFHWLIMNIKWPLMGKKIYLFV